MIFDAFSGESGGAIAEYQIQKSLRFRATSSTSLQRSTGVTSNRQRFTMSLWVKRGNISVQNIFGVGTAGGANSMFQVAFTSDNLTVSAFDNGSSVFGLDTIANFRDVAAWYHVVLAYDSTHVTPSNRVLIYVNGDLQTTSIRGGYSQQFPPQNRNENINVTGLVHYLGFLSNSTYFDGYLAEVNFVDGLALGPNSFGQTSPSTGVWSPIAFIGARGTNGFYLPFTENTSLTTASNAGIGKDFSGNTNYFTSTNISITPGITYDSMDDVPLSFGTTDRGNYCVMLSNEGFYTSPTLGVKNGNLDCYSAYFPGRVKGSHVVNSGKWYWESTLTGFDNGTTALLGIARDTNFEGDFPHFAYYSNGQFNGAAYGAAYAINDVIGVALDMDVGTLTFYKNGVSQGVATSGLSGYFCPSFSDNIPSDVTGVTFSFNFGQRAFAHTTPTSHKKLHTGNFAPPSIIKSRDHFDIRLRTGTGAGVTISDLAFQPGLILSKSRSTLGSNVFVDIVTGPSTTVEVNTSPEVSNPLSINGFLSNGYTIGASPLTNTNGTTYVDWIWKTSGSTSNNTAGTLTSTVSSNPTSGVSIVEYVGGGNFPDTVGHGLGVPPELVLVKSRDGTHDWFVYSNLVGRTRYLVLNTSAKDVISGGAWFDTWPTSTLITLGNSTEVNTIGERYSAYCFASVPGFSKVGSYVGSGLSTGPFVACGFRPMFVMVKRTDVVGNWQILDTSRSITNPANRTLLVNDPGSEIFDSNRMVEFYSNGFKLASSLAEFNAGGGSFMYIAFAHSPVKYSLAH